MPGAGFWTGQEPFKNRIIIGFAPDSAGRNPYYNCTRVQL